MLEIKIQEAKKAYEVMKKLVEERRKSPESPRSDLLGQALNDMATQRFLTENLIAFLVLGLTVAAVETISAALTLTLKFISEHPTVIHQLEVSKFGLSTFRNSFILLSCN